MSLTATDQSKTTASNGKETARDIRTLSFLELQSLLRQLNEEVESMRQTVDDLKLAISKCKTTITDLDQVKSATPGQIHLIPITDSMYARAEIVNVKEATVEIGAGYYAKLPIDVAQRFIQRKADILSGKLVEMSPRYENHSSMLTKVLEVYQEAAARTQEARTATTASKKNT